MGIKYRFIYQSIHDVEYTVNIMQSGYSGSVTSRHLGKAPVLHMKDGDPFRATSCDLTLECQSDGEFAQFYTSNPLEFQVAVFRDNTQIWTGFLATEIYSEPNIAPPYDVSVTATDGLGTLKEYLFEPVGLQSLGAHMIDLLQKTGLDLAIDWAMSLSQAGGTVPDFVDTVSINLDYMAGENCYTVLETLLVSLHATITQYDGRWLIIRETDIAVGSGNIPVYRTPSRSGSTSATSISGGRRSVGKMGTADMWPVGYTTRRAVPAKRRITVEAPWHIANVAPSVQDDEWSIVESSSFVEKGNGNSYYSILGNRVSSALVYGRIAMAVGLNRFTKAVGVTVLSASGEITPSGMYLHHVGIAASYTPVGGTPYYWNGSEWDDDYGYIDETVNVVTEVASEAETHTFVIPPYGDTTVGLLTIQIIGLGARVFDVDVRPVINSGYRDELVLGNGARGDGDKVSITGGRMTEEYFEMPDSYQGIWRESSSDSSHPVYLFTDNNFGSKDFMSIQALSRALSVATHRVELYGTLDFPSAMTRQPIAVRSNGDNYLVTSYDWDMYNEEFKFNAVTLPSGSISVTSETVTSLGNSDAGFSGVNSGGRATPGASNLPDVTGSDDGKVLTVVNGAWDKDDVPKELPTVASTDNGKLLEVVSGQWAVGARRDDLPAVMASDAGKIMQVTDNGFWALTQPQFMKFVSLSSMAEYNAISPKDPTTFYLIGTPSVTYIYLYTQLIWSET